MTERQQQTRAQLVELNRLIANLTEQSSDLEAANQSLRGEQAKPHGGCLSGTDHPHTQNTHSLPHWGYGGDSIYGHEAPPAQWGGLCEEYRMACDGKQQSPIDIVTADLVAAPELNKLQFQGQNNDGTILNNGHTIQVPNGECPSCALDTLRHR